MTDVTDVTDVTRPPGQLRNHRRYGGDDLRSCSHRARTRQLGHLPAEYPGKPVVAVLPGIRRGEVLGSGTDMRKNGDDDRAGLIADCAMAGVDSGPARSSGQCMTMGTASAMTAAVEAPSMTMPGASSLPDVDAGHERIAAAAGARGVDLVRQDRGPAEILTREAYEVPEDELVRRRADRTSPFERCGRGYGALCSEHVTHADVGRDFTFLSRAGRVPEPDAG